MSRRLTWVFVLGVALSLAALIASNDQDAIANLLRHDIGSLMLKVAMVVFAGGLVLVLFREKLSKALEATLFWAVPWSLLAALALVILLMLLAFRLRDRKAAGSADDRPEEETEPTEAPAGTTRGSASVESAAVGQNLLP